MVILKLDKVDRGPQLSTLVASSISREIAQGRLKSGDQLPTEQALAASFGVSRNVVREAIARLRSEGRIWSQQGRGAFVADASQRTVFSIDEETLWRADAFRSLFELRGILEVQAAALAAARRTDIHLAAMSAALTRMRGEAFGSADWLRCDLEFHLAIADATGNDYICQFLGFVSARVRESILAAGMQKKPRDLADITLGEHDRILSAIAAGDSEGASAAMQDHLSNAAIRVGLSEGGLAVEQRPKRQPRKKTLREETK